MANPNGRKSLTQDEFVSRANQIHGNKFDYSKTKFIATRLKVIITCHIHGDFEQVANSHLLGTGCRKCAGWGQSTDDFIKKAIITHGDRYDYSNTKYIDCYTKVKIICKKHGDFYQTPRHHIANIGCPKCKSSKGEEKIRAYLWSSKINFEEQKRFTGCKNNRTLPFDFYLPDHNTIIEFDGRQHHLPFSFNNEKSKDIKLKNLERVIEKDNIKNEYCKNNNIHLLRIKYIDICDTEKKISAFLSLI
jgi:very-short-patch-repair endonuclease